MYNWLKQLEDIEANAKKIIQSMPPEMREKIENEVGLTKSFRDTISKSQESINLFNNANSDNTVK